MRIVIQLPKDDSYKKVIEAEILLAQAGLEISAYTEGGQGHGRGDSLYATSQYDGGHAIRVWILDACKGIELRQE